MTDIDAKVANVVGANQLAMNAGSAQGVEIGDTVLLYRTVDVQDPDTGEPLGSVLLPKLNLRVNHVQRRLCVAVVTDAVASDTPYINITRLSTTKEVTTDSSQADSRNTVFVKIGEAARIRKSPRKDEPPF